MSEQGWQPRTGERVIYVAGSAGYGYDTRHIPAIFLHRSSTRRAVIQVVTASGQVLRPVHVAAWNVLPDPPVAEGSHA